MDRRGFLGSILAACAAPAIVRADALMRVVPRELTVIPVTVDWLDCYFPSPGFIGFTGVHEGRHYINGHPFGAQPRFKLLYRK